MRRLGSIFSPASFGLEIWPRCGKHREEGDAERMLNRRVQCLMKVQVGLAGPRLVLPPQRRFPLTMT